MNTRATLLYLVAFCACLVWQTGFADLPAAAALGPPQLNDRVMPWDDMQKLNRQKNKARPAVEKGFDYVAVKGDTVTSITSIYNKALAPRGMQTSAELVRRANAGIKGERLGPGQKLFIPAVQGRPGKT